MKDIILLLLLLTCSFLSLWVFNLQSELRDFRKKFTKGSYWIQYLPMGSVLVLNKLKAINEREVESNQSLANAIVVEIGVRGVSTKDYKQLDLGFIQTELTLPDNVSTDEAHDAALVSEEYNKILMRGVCKHLGVVKA
jgi:hypothetical protein